MKKFKETELTENLQRFKDNKSIEIDFDKSIVGNINLENATVLYDSKNGYINIMSKDGNFKINTTLVYGYGSENDEICIDLESLEIKIKKIK